ncbi:hypothetical protein FEM03_19260 [Phragmitibacter flavus]|uniref:Uncharacterized protein n=1 Tax=Phragmitibacter flavus TaxID=2576071 RepID=A0A5R8KAD7_9BACT|nr:hypothetical protein [Phragmitibacter flavus]TLD69237.1 hypothetical protein FEM03_19260 [Phragmitibacter flavus]
MKDNEIRGLVLDWFYDRRRQQRWELPSAADIGSPSGVTDQNVVLICDQLGQHGLIDWKPIHQLGGVSFGHGKINANGVDVIEGTVTSPISISMDNSQNITISNSSNTAISGSNTQANTITIQDLISQIQNAEATWEEKEEAKGLLKRFLSHPLVASVSGSLVGLLD